MHKLLRSCFLATLLCSVCSMSHASSIEGYVYKPFGHPYGAVCMGADRVGATPAYGQACTWEAAPVGWYSIGMLSQGIFTVGINEKDEWKRTFAFGVAVGTGTTNLDFTYEYPNYVGGIWYDANPRGEYCQSFVATGTSIISVSVRTASNATVRITIHDTDPNGPQIGPARLVDAGYGSSSCGFWNAGEVPTTPGHIYCVKLRNNSPQGLQPFYEAVKDLMSNVYPEGKTWVDGVQVDRPICTVIGQDDDGIVTTVSTNKFQRLTGQWVGSVIGQTFTANGTSVLSVSALVGNSTDFIASVHDSVGADGSGGTQIGPAHYFKGVAWNARSIAVWAPGEVPITPGQTYYVKIRRVDGQGFVIYRTAADEYSGGACYIAGTVQPYDLGTTIACEAYSGSTILPSKVMVTNARVTARTSDTATVSWTSAPAGSESYVEYSPNTTPYTNSKPDTSGTSNHTVTLTDLQPNTLYHCRVVTKAAGMRDGISRDFAFVTDPSTPNLLSNPGFESGAFGSWVKIGAGDIGIRNYPAGGASGWFGGCKAHTGNWFLGGAGNGYNPIGGAYQRVAVTAGRLITLRAWLWTYQTTDHGNAKDMIVWGRVGIDPTGGTDPSSGNLVWSGYATAQDWYLPRNSKWIDMAVTATPTSGYATAFLQAGCDTAIEWTVWGWDDACMAQAEPPPTPVSRIADLRAIADGTRVSIADKIVTASAAQAGAAYIEESDRAAGVRVESSDEFLPGHKVTVVGYKGAKSTGEIYLYSARIASDAAAVDLSSMTIVAKEVGQVHASNVALLMRVAGTVSAGGSEYVYLNDGSLSGNGLKVITKSLTSTPEEGRVYAITGIVQLEGSSPSNAVPVLRPRSQADCQAVN